MGWRLHWELGSGVRRFTGRVHRLTGRRGLGYSSTGYSFSYLSSSLAAHSPLDLDLLSSSLSAGSSAGAKVGKWPKAGKPGKEASREDWRSPGPRSRENPKWLAKLGWWKEARPCLGGGGGGEGRG